MTAVQVVLGTAVPVGLAVLWMRRVRAHGGTASASSFGLGALVFVASQVVHLPLNSGLEAAFGPAVRALPVGTALWVNATILGLSAGLCEELARYFFFQFSGLRGGPGARAREQAILVGLGHGGIESILFGTLLVSVSIVQLLALERSGVESVAPDAETRAAVETALAAVRDAPWWSPLLGAAERLMVIPFHVSATMLVLVGVVRGQRLLVAAAVFWHAVLDGLALVVMGTSGAVAAELALLCTVPVSVAVTILSYRALPAPVVEEDETAESTPTGAPLELALATKRYGTDPEQRPALQRASLLLEPGTRTCLLGVNGAGKTTAMRLVLGALAPSSGRAWLYGKSHDDPGLLAAKRRIGVVPQQPGMYEDLTVRQYLELVQALYGRGDLAAVARRLRLEGHLDRPMSRHSGGEQRRIVLAAAILPEPELLLLDEPSSGLDPLAQVAMRELLRELSPGRTILLCTHDLDEAEALADRVVILDRGEVKVHERIDTLKARFPLRLRVVADDAERTADALRAAGAGEVETTARGARARIDTRAEVPALLRALLGAGVAVEEAVVEEASLADIFAATVAGTLPAEEVPS